MSGDYRLILPLMFATVVSTFISERLRRENIYTLKLVRRGIQIKSGRDVDVLQSVTVNEVMRTDIVTVTPDLPLEPLLDLLTRTHHHGLPVLTGSGELWGIVTITDVDRALAANVPRSTTVADIGTPRHKMFVAFPDETVDEILSRMSIRGLGRMPVVRRDKPDRFLGLVRRADIIRAYNLALSRRAKKQHHASRMRLRNIDGTEFVDVSLEPGDPAVGQSVKNVALNLPEECILISIRRNNRVLIPHGDTIFQPGDQLTAFIRTKDTKQLYRCLRRQPLTSETPTAGQPDRPLRPATPELNDRSQ